MFILARQSLVCSLVTFDDKHVFVLRPNCKTFYQNFDICKQEFNIIDIRENKNEYSNKGNFSWWYPFDNVILFICHLNWASYYVYAINGKEK